MSKSKENKKLLTVSNVLQPYKEILANFSDEIPLKAKLIDTPLGQMLAISYTPPPDMIVFLMFVESRHFDREIRNLMKRYSTQIIDDGDVKPFQTVESELNAYFRGELTKFVDTRFTICSSETEFTRTVWRELMKIGYGETTTFSALAKRLGKPNGAQPVANACSRNCMSLIIPCHRIMSASGKTSVNNSCIERRNWLLDHEQKYAPKNTHTEANHTS